MFFDFFSTNICAFIFLFCPILIKYYLIVCIVLHLLHNCYSLKGDCGSNVQGYYIWLIFSMNIAGLLSPFYVQRIFCSAGFFKPQILYKHTTFKPKKVQEYCHCYCSGNKDEELCEVSCHKSIIGLTKILTIKQLSSQFI